VSAEEDRRFSRHLPPTGGSRRVCKRREIKPKRVGNLQPGFQVWQKVQEVFKEDSVDHHASQNISRLLITFCSPQKKRAISGKFFKGKTVADGSRLGNDYGDA